MTLLARHRVIFSLAAAAFIIIFATVAIFWARGFKPNFKNGTIERTGLIVASSVPTGAQVYLDNRLTSATNTNIAYLAPKTYSVRIQKDGYTTWQKDIEIKADLATEIKALLFPLAPEIKPLTTTGAASPSLSSDYSKIVYGVGGDHGGAYIIEMSDTPFPFRSGPKQIAKNQIGFDFSKAKFIWGPDSKQLIAYFQNEQGQATSNLLIATDKSNDELRDITGSLTATLSSWQQDLVTHAQTQALPVPQDIKSATQEANITASPTPTLVSPTAQLNYYPTGLIFSPDEEKILYKDKTGKYKVYDLKTKKESALGDIADIVNISWYPDSNHLVIAQKDLISIIEADGANKMTIYSGKFEDARPPATDAAGFVGQGFVFAHPSGTKIIILTTLTQTEGTPSNLYSINLR